MKISFARLWRSLLAITAFAVTQASLPVNAAAQSGEMPAGHPGVPSEPVADRSSPSKEVAAGTVDVQVVDATGAPLPNTKVRLGVMFRSIGEGESRSEKFAQTDSEGKARFSDLKASSDYSYRVTVASGAATYATTPFALARDMGQSVLLHIYPVTRNLDEALVGMRGMIYIQTRDDVFQFEALFRVFNIGRVTWVPEKFGMTLPSGFKAFKAGEAMNDTRFEATDNGVVLKGTFTPGQHDVNFRFQIPRSAESSAAFRMGLPPRTADLQVIAEASSSMDVEVEGFDPPIVTSSQTGQRVLVTRRTFKRDEMPDSVSISLSGIPTPGAGRWVAVALALAFAVGGFASSGLQPPAKGKKKKKNERGSAEDLNSARELLFNELVAVERAHKQGDLGPRAYAQAKQTLVDALARIGV